jgi:hypothetical protein
MGYAIEASVCHQTAHRIDGKKRSPFALRISDGVTNPMTLTLSYETQASGLPPVVKLLIEFSQ